MAQQFASSDNVHSRQPCAAHSNAATYSVAAFGHEMARAADPSLPVPWQASSPPAVQMESPQARVSVHHVPEGHAFTAQLLHSLSPSTANCQLVPVPAKQPEVHGSADQLAPPSLDDSILPIQASEVGPLTWTPCSTE